ncbi:MAG TPA: GNAT family N-acetyltransferase [Flavobacterium sp.]|uniref:GNAT family N-acetyltransferase n=1 Tax=Flavobacterium sp. TaxID=239 RepID=UPI0028E9EF6B|nr:GNAT family N-acetyltransferase [uncultured Flavobacterium sp.]
MENQFLIQKATFSDAQNVANLIISLLKELNLTLEQKFEFDNEQYTEMVHHSLLNGNIFNAFLAYDRENLSTPIGIVTVVSSYAIYNLGEFGTITEFYVVPNYRSKGLGNVMIKKVKEFCIEKKWNKLEVGAPTEKNWPRTISFYENNGFNKKGPKLRLDI